MTSICAPTGIVMPKRALAAVVDDGRQTGDATGGELVRDEERVERERGHHDADASSARSRAGGGS